MNPLEDRLSRLSALRSPRQRIPVSHPGNTIPSNFNKLLHLLDGTIQKNSLGSHMLVRRFFDEPRVEKIESRAMELLLPGSAVSAGDPGRWLFLDTETTGLSGGTGTYAFLVGIGWWQDDGFVVEQYFMRDHSEEPSLLYGLLQRMKQRPVLITYNGRSFDWPLLQTRCRMTRAAEFLTPLAHLDLLYPARRLWRLRLKSVALTQVETHILGFDRGRDIPSETIPQLYFNFLRGDGPEGIADVFYHNQMDLCGLAFLALRIFKILTDPEHSGCRAEELFGISRLLRQRGDTDLAERICRKAIEGGLPASAEKIGLRELALAAKRRGDFELSNALWEKLLGCTAEGLKAYEQLAIYCEHHAGFPERATHWTREALVKLQEGYRAGRITAPQYMRWHTAFRHRMTRLSRKIQD
ncbi:MAG: ribonuclease H-like domain-containing protein [Acidobacteria bacterium]|nr:ribonuclease H-like domain-containing protein [Acidobacteriota bacterium]